MPRGLSHRTETDDNGEPIRIYRRGDFIVPERHDWLQSWSFLPWKRWLQMRCQHSHARGFPCEKCGLIWRPDRF